MPRCSSQRYDTDTITDADGNVVRPAPGDPGSIGIGAVAPIVWYVSQAKLLGANYGVMVVLPFANAALEAPAFTFGQTVDTSIADMVVRPLDLGWRTKRADVTAGLQFYVPTGRYERGGSDNIGKGMFTYEPFVGTTVYFDEKRTVSLATTAYLNSTATRKTPKPKSARSSPFRADSVSRSSAAG